MQSSNNKKMIFIILASLGLLLCILGIALAVLLFRNATQAPGEGKKAEQGYALCAPVIAALESYYGTEGSYPQSLEELSPNYLTDLPIQEDGSDLDYTAEGSSYSLGFHYTNLGFNECTYRPESGWDCNGYY